ncbi:hypothetical protein PHMEG_00033292 [Phytophthora megakarya]|uniref:C2H2-type domain-containing protein n=1 Tax=Phytophthora megakarya TaxID=4795 RepID=A0A225UUJ0_9STRA|nr:hypothetical protein PHMEG_00033292 [Phytophthora megakarya]
MNVLHQQATYSVCSHDILLQQRTYSFMHSRGGGVEQAPHQDYAKEAITDVTSAYPGLPCSLIIALIPGTRLKVFAGCFTTVDVTKAVILELCPGDAVLFRVDPIHCGMAYDDNNYRLHCYVTVPGPAFEPVVVAGVNEKVFTCQYCGFQDSASSAIRQHRIYCSKNPKQRTRPKEKRKCPQCGKTFASPGGYRNHRFRYPDCVATSSDI